MKQFSKSVIRAGRCLMRQGIDDTTVLETWLVDDGAGAHWMCRVVVDVAGSFWTDGDTTISCLQARTVDDAQTIWEPMT